MSPDANYAPRVDKVLDDELVAIRTRRELPPSVEIKDLRGLAFSGGGIRAACVALGLVQALQAKGMMYLFDYLSTVSGGGYLGAYLSSSVVKKGAASDRENLYPEICRPADQRRDDELGQPKRALRFVFGGKYLNKPWQLANKYLSGLFWNNVAIVSALAAVSSLVALAWRCLDLEVVRTALRLAPWNLDYDSFAAFLPFLLLLPAWLVVWFFSYAGSRGEAPGRWAQVLLYCTAASFLIGCAIIVGNDTTTLDPITRSILGTRNTTVPEALKNGLLAGLLSTLLPFLRPQKLLQLGMNPRGFWDKCIFRVACTALLVGVPLGCVAILGKEDISFTSIDDEHNIRADEIYDLPAFCHLIGTIEPQESGGSAKSALFAVKPTPTQRTPGLPTPAELSQIRALSAGLLRDRVEVQHLRDRWDDFSPREKLGAVFSQVATLRAAGLDSPAGQTARDWWREQQDLERGKVELCEQFSQKLLPFPQFLAGLAPSKTLIQGFERPQPEVDWPYIRDQLKAIRAVDVELVDDNLILDVALATRTNIQNQPQQWTAKEWKAFNHELLFALHSECFHKPGISRPVVIVADQGMRARWFVGSAVIFVLASLLVDLNATSLHRFYRNRLAYAYIEPQTPKADGDPAAYLSGLQTTQAGAPYHLINASLNRFDSRFGRMLEQLDDESLKEEPDRRSTRNFLFSQLYCGSDVTGYRKTESYEKLMGKFSLADAIALSGAALHPVQFDFAPLSWMMTALNLRVAQWLPNPRFNKRRWYPRVASLIVDFLRKQPERHFCCISDGGFSENLGVMPLLRRRCELIVALDAGHDPKHQFQDLARVIRHARLNDGIEICEFAESNASHRPLSLDTSTLRLDADGQCRQHFLLARIVYPDRPEGLLVYIKPSFTGDESPDLLQYRGSHDEFPHDSTSDQVYDDVRVECYRRLGEHMGEDVCDLLFEKLQPDTLKQSMTDRFKEMRRDAAAKAAQQDRVAYGLERLAGALYLDNSGPAAAGKSHPAAALQTAVLIQLKRPPKSGPGAGSPPLAGSAGLVDAAGAKALHGIVAFHSSFPGDELPRAAAEIEPAWQEERNRVSSYFGELAAEVEWSALQLGELGFTHSAAELESLGTAWRNLAQALNGVAGPKDRLDSSAEEPPLWSPSEANRDGALEAALISIVVVHRHAELQRIKFKALTDQDQTPWLAERKILASYFEELAEKARPGAGVADVRAFPLLCAELENLAAAWSHLASRLRPRVPHP